MLTANLLPAEDQKNIDRERLKRIIRFFGILWIVGLSMGIALLSPSFFPLYLRAQELERALEIERSAFERMRLEGFAGRTEEVRRLLDRINAFSGNAPVVSPLIRLLLQQAGGQIFVQTIAVSPDGAFFMNGRAETRDGLLAFERALQESGLFEKITLPLASIVLDANIPFSLQGTMKMNPEHASQ